MEKPDADSLSAAITAMLHAARMHDLPANAVVYGALLLAVREASKAMDWEEFLKRVERIWQRQEMNNQIFDELENDMRAEFGFKEELQTFCASRGMGVSDAFAALLSLTFSNNVHRERSIDESEKLLVESVRVVAAAARAEEAQREKN